MKILKASHLGMCFGVRDAIALATQQADSGPVTILGELVHNETVLADLDAKGIQLARELSAVTTPTVIITAHGASERAMNQVRASGFSVVEATCPLVHHAHQMLARLVLKGYHPIVIGNRGHVEVRGMTGDLDDFDVVLTEADVVSLAERPRFGIVAQTTQPISKVRNLVELIRNRFPKAEVRFIDTVCQPTKQRQAAAVELARQCDVVIIIGGANSNNTRELVATCRRECSRVHHVLTELELSPEWFREARTVVITSVTTTPDTVIDCTE